MASHERSIFMEALDFADPAEREAHLLRVCGGDDRLRARVEALIRRHQANDGLPLDRSPILDLVEMADPPQTAEGPGSVIGPYRLLEAIGEGGMGVVHVAEQSQPVRRRVALKVIKPGMDTKQVIARFEAERQALAMMDHPNVAKVFDGGTTESGRPYFVMELVRGLPITEYCDGERLSIRERLELFVLVCRAVQHAHQKGIIHRDLKPSNILVTRHDGVPVPKVIDFGVAKATGGGLTEKTVYTAFTQLIGTPLYMSPEQVELSGLDIDTRSDIYSLGVLLFELLTGTTPFDSETLRRAAFDEMRRIIREEEPPKPSTRLSTLGATLTTASTKRSSDPRHLNRSVLGELDWIAMKALEKDRTRRYETANDLASDVQCYLTDQPVQACPPSARYRFHKFARRNKAVLTTAALVIATLMTGAVVSVWQAVRAIQAEARAESHRKLAEGNASEAARQRDEARRQKLAVVTREASLRRYLYAADMKLAWQAWSNAWNKDDLDQVRRLMARHGPDAGREDVRSFVWYYLNGLCGQSPRWTLDGSTLGGHEGKVYHLAISPDGQTLASASEDGTAKLWDLATAHLRHTLRGHAGEVNCVAFAPDGRELSTASDDGSVRVWDPVSGREHTARALTGFDMPVHRVDYSADGRLVVTGELSERWDAAATSLWDVSARQPRVRMEGHFPLALSPDAHTLATTNWDMAVRLWDVASRQERAVLRGHTEIVLTGAFSPDGGTVATGSGDGTVRLWGLHGPRGVKQRWRVPLRVHSVAYSPDGKLLAAGDESGAVYLWETSGGLPTAVFGGHAQRVRAVRFTPDGRTLASAGDDRTVKLWDVTVASLAQQPPDQPKPFTALSFSPDGELLATSLGASHGMLWNVRTGEARALTLHRPEREVTSVAFSPAGRILATTGSDQSLSLVDPITGSQRLAIAGPGVSNGSLTFSPDGGMLVGDGDDDVLRIWDTNTGKILHALTKFIPVLDQKTWKRTYVPASAVPISSPWAFAFSPDGRTLAVQSYGEVTCWDLATGAPCEPWTRSMSGVNCLAYSPDGQTLATGDNDRQRIILWDTRTGRARANLREGADSISTLAFSPDGRTLATCGGSGKVTLWDVATAQEMIRLDGHTGSIHHAAFSPDGRTLATAGASADGQRGELRFWRAEPAESPGNTAKQEERDNPAHP
ncbi:MAG: WD40 repeat domain-containing serine/threonine protein kinase [Isosphaeraceae bacterium]